MTFFNNTLPVEIHEIKGGITMNVRISLTLFFLFVFKLTLPVPADDWPLWGRDSSRNMVSPEKGIPEDFNVGEFRNNSEEVDLSTTQNIKWVAKLGSQSYGNVTVSNGKIFIGTNNEVPRDPKHKGDRGVMMCFDEKTGAFLWQLVVPKLETGRENDWEYLGICSSPSIDGDRVYVVTNRCEVVCLDVNGLSNGNDGPYKNEAVYMAEPGNPPIEPGKTDADIIWRFDMRKKLNVFPHNITSSSVLPAGERLYVTTSNGQDLNHSNLPSPHAPCIIALDKHSGELIGMEASGISRRVMHCNWSSPSFGEVNGRDMVFFGAGDGYCYGFDPVPAKNDDDTSVLKELWRFDCVPNAYKTAKYLDPEGPSEIIATPVFYKNRVYVSIGQDPEHGDGDGHLVCIDASKNGGITGSGAVWSYKKITRSLSTASIVDDLIFVSDYAGMIHCLNADTGEAYWVHDTLSHIWGSTLVVDGKVYIGNEDGYLIVLAADKTEKVLNEIDMGAPIYSTPVVANGVLYVSTQTHLYAIGKKP